MILWRWRCPPQSAINMAGIIRPVKGTRDFYPELMAQRMWLYNRIRAVSESYGYQEWEAPMIEALELYAAKSGEELVKEQAFVFPDRGGALLTLRPELTPSLARLIAQRARELPRPIRWWSFGPFWRYERPQKGRTREFFQWNIDLLGSASIVADAEIASIGAGLLAALGLTSQHIVISVNSRRLMEARVADLGVRAEERPKVFRLLDRLDKLPADKWAAEGTQLGLSDQQLSDLQLLMQDREQWRSSPELTAFFDTCSALGTREWFDFDPTIVRGLDYYTGMVFEARDRDGEFRAILGGGRYDNLVADVGGDPITGVGFAMGDVVVQLVLEKYGVLPKLRAAPADVLVTVFSAELLPASAALAHALRAAGLRAELYPEADKLAKQLKYADRLAIPFATVLGPDEVAESNVTIKQLVSTTQLKCALTAAPQALLRLRDGAA